AWPWPRRELQAIALLKGHTRIKKHANTGKSRALVTKSAPAPVAAAGAGQRKALAVLAALAGLGQLVGWLGSLHACITFGSAHGYTIASCQWMQGHSPAQFSCLFTRQASHIFSRTRRLWSASVAFGLRGPIRPQVFNSRTNR